VTLFHDWVRLSRGMGHTEAACEGDTKKIVVCSNLMQADHLSERFPNVQTFTIDQCRNGRHTASNRPIVFDHFTVLRMLEDEREQALGVSYRELDTQRREIFSLIVDKSANEVLVKHLAKMLEEAETRAETKDTALTWALQQLKKQTDAQET
jgi:hypothetical protein